MAEEANELALIDRVMDKIEAFYFGDGDDGGEAIFYKFAQEHHHIFDEDCDAEEVENKVE